MKKLKIAIVAGHGGDTNNGAVVDGFVEDELNLAVAKRVAFLLSGHSQIEPVLIRDSDVEMKFHERNARSNEAGCELVVSIHFNAYSESWRRGCEIYTWSGNHRTKTIGDVVRLSMPRSLLPGRSWIASTDKSPRPYNVLKAFDASAILVECAFLTSPFDREYLSQPTALDEIAEGIAMGLTSAPEIMRSKC